MHILTKVFIVLVSLLAILMVPLVVVSTLNQEHWRRDALEATADAKASRSDLSSKLQLHQQQVAQLNEQLAVYSQREQSHVAESEGFKTQITDLQGRLIVAESNLASCESRHNAIVESMQTSNELSAKLVQDLELLRDRALTAERQRVELDERLAELDSQLQVGDSVQRALREENEQLKRNRRSLENRLGEYVARFGELESDTLALDEGIAPDRNLEATVLDVARSPEQTLVEIDAGSRDGVQQGWILTIGEGGTFIGRLRIIDVDLNRSTGILTLEKDERGQVKAGQRAYALAGQN